MRKGFRSWAGLWLGVGMMAASLLGMAAAQSEKARQTEEAAIRAVIQSQAEAWNKGDVAAFMASYENSPETTFVGSSSVNKGFEKILERYKKNYTSRQQMGALTFSDLDVRLLPTSSGAIEFAVATGKFHLERAEKGLATKDDGIFSLVWRKGPGGWKILLDHTA
jgi:uncharacterized protein (TIGR02246 family)